MSNVSRGCCLSNRCGVWCRTLLCHSVRIALPDEVFVGLNTLVGLAYLSGYERIVVPKSAICIFEKSSRSHRWTRFVAPNSYQELFTQMV